MSKMSILFYRTKRIFFFHILNDDTNQGLIPIEVDTIFSQNSPENYSKPHHLRETSLIFIMFYATSTASQDGNAGGIRWKDISCSGKDLMLEKSFDDVIFVCKPRIEKIPRTFGYRIDSKSILTVLS
jgi:hypothetical protein